MKFLPILLFLFAALFYQCQASAFKAIKWILYKDFKPDSDRFYQECIGIHGGDGSNRSFVGRIFEREGHFVGQILPFLKGFWYAHGEKEIGGGIPNNLEILVYPYGSMTWTYRDHTPKACGSDDPPPNMVLAAFDPDTGEPVYICRCVDNTQVVLGTLRLSEPRGCKMSWGGVRWSKEMEILSLSMVGIAMKAVQ